MAILPRFATPANLADSNLDAWTETVTGLFARAARDGEFPQFYNPTLVDTPDDASVARIIWPAFPASLQGSLKERLDLADKHRGAQDEYCEWAVEKNTDGDITRVTFTTAVPEYFDHLFDTDQDDRLLATYHKLIGPEVRPEQLEQNGAYLRVNQWNDSTKGRAVHLIQTTNNLFAAIALATEATILRQDADGKPVTNAQTLVECAKLGEPLRGSDPQIAATVNDAAASGAEITLKDPLGLYIDGLITGGMETPDDEDPAAFWSIELGDADHVLNASYEVPKEQERGYVVGDIKIDGRPIGFGGQLAVRVRVRLEALVKPGNHQPSRQPCRTD